MPETLIPAAEYMQIHCIALDETEHWCLADDMMAVIDKIEQLYYYDASTRTHVCEITPSYWLEPYDVRFSLKPGVEISEEFSDKIDGELRGEQSVGQYMHCLDVESIAKRYETQGVMFSYRFYEAIALDPEMDYDEQFNNVCELLTSNSPM